MAISKELTISDCTSLGLGEKVEVLQQTKGLRGSWQPAVIIMVKTGRRVVEYTGLFKHKLTESFSVMKDSQKQSMASRQKVGGIFHGFLRPIPPERSDMDCRGWRRGLLVDAFSQGAWWEGVLLEDIAVVNEGANVKVYFPDEGDENSVSVKDLRISQEWDEVSGIWAAKGHWRLFSASGHGRVTTFKELKHLGADKESGELQLRKESAKQIQPLVSFGNPKRHKRDSQHKIKQHDSSRPHTFEQHKSFLLEMPQNHPVYRLKQQEEGAHIITEKRLRIRENVPPESTTKAGSVGWVQSAEFGFKSNLFGNRSCMKILAAQTAASENSFENNGLSTLKDRKHFLNKSVALKDIVKESRLSAKKFLQDAGWTIEFHHRFGRTREAVYVSPSGRRYYSLTMACKGWKKSHNISMNFGQPEGREMKLLSTYNLTQNLEWSKVILDKMDTRGKSGKKSSFQRDARNAPVEAFTIVKATKAHLLPQTVSSSTNTSEKTLSIHDDEAASENGRLVPAGDSTIDSGELYKRKQCSWNKTSKDIQELSFQSSLGRRGQRLSCTMVPTRTKEMKKKRLAEQEMCCVKRKKKSVCTKKADSFEKNKGGKGQRGRHMQVLLSISGKDAVSGCTEASYHRKRTVLSWLIDMGVLKENEQVRYLNKDGHILKEGNVTREGARCGCCDKFFTLSNFELHAGSELHRPCANIFVSDGRCLLECQMEAWELQKKSIHDSVTEESMPDESDDTCNVCGDGGELLLCDHCPSAFHVECVGLLVIPEGNWYCPSCCCASCVGSLFACVEETFTCSQCERKYHVGCSSGVSPKVDYGAENHWFCGQSCEKIFSDLQKLIGVSHCLGKPGLSWMLLKCIDEENCLVSSNLELVAEYNSKLSVARGVMQECFFTDD